MANIIPLCKSREKDTREKLVAEGILNEDCGLVGDGRTDGRERVRRMTTDGK